MLLALTAAVFVSCGPSKGSKGAFAGSFTDEFGNHFVLNDDHTTTITIAGNKSVTTSWNEYSVFATIEYNGDHKYYYLYNGALYRHKAQMKAGRAAIKIKYD